MKKISRKMVLLSILVVMASLAGAFASVNAVDAKVKIGVSVADQSNVFYIDILDEAGMSFSNVVKATIQALTLLRDQS